MKKFVQPTAIFLAEGLIVLLSLFLFNATIAFGVTPDDEFIPPTLVDEEEAESAQDVEIKLTPAESIWTIDQKRYLTESFTKRNGKIKFPSF